MGRATSIRAIAAGISDVGRQREHNEDSYAIDDEHGLFVVADGMGGHSAGDVASRLATSTISDFFRTLAGEDVTWPTHFDRSLSDEENRLLTSIGIANRRIFETSQATRSLAGMGTTVVGAHFSVKKKRMYVGHVGDSRAYRIRDGQIHQLTRDHSLVNEPFPELTEAERAELPKNVITRALGMQDNVVVDLTSDDVKDGDIYLLCSDGLSGMLSDDAILSEIVAARAKEGRPGSAFGTQPDGADSPILSKALEDLCARLVQRANEAGGEDNITALAIHIEELEPAPSSRRPNAPDRDSQVDSPQTSTAPRAKDSGRNKSAGSKNL